MAVRCMFFVRGSCAQERARHSSGADAMVKSDAIASLVLCTCSVAPVRTAMRSVSHRWVAKQPAAFSLLESFDAAFLRRRRRLRRMCGSDITKIINELSRALHVVPRNGLHGFNEEVCCVLNLRGLSGSAYDC